MKKYISIVSLLLILVPSIALASWWNPLTWFNNWNLKKEVKEEINIISEQKEQVIVNNEDLNKTPKKEEKVKELNNKKETKIINKPVSDIKQNLVDLCPNLYGVQDVIPSGKYLYKNTNKCLTNEEIEKYENEISEKNKERENILKRLAEINGLNIYYSDLSTDKLKEILKGEEDKERNKILSGIDEDLSKKYYYSDLSNNELREVIKIEQTKKSCLSNKSPHYIFKWDEKKNTCKNILKDGYYIGCCGQIIKGVEPSSLKCGNCGGGGGFPISSA